MGRRRRKRKMPKEEGSESLPEAAEGRLEELGLPSGPAPAEEAAPDLPSMEENESEPVQRTLERHGWQGPTPTEVAPNAEAWMRAALAQGLAQVASLHAQLGDVALRAMSVQAKGAPAVKKAEVALGECYRSLVVALGLHAPGGGS